MAEILDGILVRKAVLKELKTRIASGGSVSVPGLAVIQLGDNPASTAYVNNKEKYAQKLGMHAEVHRMPASFSEPELHALIERLNADEKIHGIIVQMPLPAHIDPNKATGAVAPAKDVDGLTPENQGRLWTGRRGHRSCTPAGVMRMLDHYGVELKGRHAAIVGRSNLVGKPLAAMMLERHATVTLCHSRTRNLAEVTRSADVVVAATGLAGLITAEHVRDGAVVIDVGINFVETGAIGEDGKPEVKLVGDVAFAEVEPLASKITPVPGGVGPMTIAMLLSNTVDAWEMPQE